MAKARRSLWIVLIAMQLAHPARADICDNAQFFEQCPTADPAFATLVRDFKIRKNGVLLDPARLKCSAPVSSMPVSAWSDELALLQALRALYYMDHGRHGHLPWTPLSLYDWLRANVGGFDISSKATFDYWTGQGHAAEDDDANYIVLRARSDAEREGLKKWAGPNGIAHLVSLIAHERRHGDGIGHVRCCPAQEANNKHGACDPGYEESARISPYGIQYWLEKHWVSGDINVGIGCLAPAERAEAIRWMRQDGNSFASPPSNFCSTPPPPLSDENNLPAACSPACR
ncbi:MAG TPA: hypothetical protein VIU46_03245 [Gallionellaceae bacterium]